MATEHPIGPGVTFKSIEGWPGYCVGDDGSAWSSKRSQQHGSVAGQWHQLKAGPNHDGYPRIYLCTNGSHIAVFVSWLVLEAFVGPRPAGMECLHYDGNPGNNHVNNLSWGTRSQNEMDKVRHGTSCRGSRNGSAKLTESQVSEIKRLHRTGKYTQKKLSAEFGINQGSVSAIIRGEKWKHIP